MHIIHDFLQMEFMLETICDIKNNKKRVKEDPAHHTRIKKWLQKVLLVYLFILIKFCSSWWHGLFHFIIFYHLVLFYFAKSLLVQLVPCGVWTKTSGFKSPIITIKYIFFFFWGGGVGGGCWFLRGCYVWFGWNFIISIGRDVTSN